MPATFLLYVAMLALAALGPLAAIACLVLLCVNRWRALGLKALICSLVGAIGLSALWFVAVAILGEGLGVGEEIAWISSAGFSFGFIAYLVWLRVPRLLGKPDAGRA